MAIRSFADADTEQLFRDGANKRFAAITKAATRKLQQLDSAPTVGFMRLPPGNDLKFYDDAWHLRINRQWRLTFQWDEAAGAPFKVVIEDLHR